MRYGISVLVLLYAVSMGANAVDAQGRGKGQANRPTTTGAKAGGGNTDHAKPATAKGPKSSTPTTTTTTTHGHGPKTTTQSADAGGKAKGNPHRTTTTTTTTVVSNVTPTTPTTVHVKNPKLEARLLSLLGLPADTPITNVSSGFKNWGQFVAAVHVSENLDLDFNTLKAAMTGIPAGSPAGTTPTAQPMSLGQAVQSLRGTTIGTSSVETEIKKAETQANEDFRRTRERS